MACVKIRIASILKASGDLIGVFMFF